MAIALNNFTNLARQAAASNRDETTFLNVRGDRLSETGRLGNFFTAQATRRETIDAFVDALRAECGDHVANMIDKQFGDAVRNADKPLTSRMVLDLTRLAAEEKQRMNAYNRETVNAFLNGGDRDKNLDKAVGKLCDYYHLSSDGDRDLLRARVQIFLVDKADRGGFHPQMLTAAALFDNVKTGFPAYTGFPESFDSVLPGQHPGTAKDRLRLAELGLGDENLSFQRGLAELETMRRSQPDGDIRPETIYTALFKENPPSALGGGNQIIEAIKTRCDEEKNALLARTGNKNNLLLDWATSMPWERLASLAERPDTVTLADVRDNAAGIWSGEKQKNRAVAEKNLRGDPQRVGLPPRTGTPQPENSPALPVPTFSFKLYEGDGGTRSVQVGRKTNFTFADDADIAAYRGVGDNSLSRRLGELCVDICGPGASELQVTRVMNCVTQGALLPLKHAAGLAGAHFNEHSNVSVSLSRSPDGSIRADFSSPEEGRDALGHFSMSLSIARDGTMTMTEFELVPPKDIRDQRALEARDAANAAAIAARRALENEAAALCKLDESAGGLFAEIKARAGLRAPGAKIEQRAWEPFARDLAKRLGAEMVASPTPLTSDQKLAMRKAGMDEFFSRLNNAATLVPLKYYGDFISFCLETADVPDEDILSAMQAGPARPGMPPMPSDYSAMQPMINDIADGFKAIIGARDMGEARKKLDDLGVFLRKATIHNPVFEGNRGIADFTGALVLLMRLGMLELMGDDNPQVFAKALTRSGPFRDMLHTLTRADADKGEEANALREEATVTMAWFTEGLKNILPDDVLDELKGGAVRERDLSLSSQRAILGEGKYVARGAETVMPELAGLNQHIARDMPVILGSIRKKAGENLLNGPPGSRTDLGLSEQFHKDYERDGIFVNGRYYHPAKPEKGGTETSERDFTALFPDARTAGMLSNLAAQNLPGFFMQAMIMAVPAETRDEFYTVFNGLMSDTKVRKEQNIRIDTLDAGQGQYRIATLYCASSDNANSVLERCAFEVAMDVNLGAPGTNGAPSVENVHTDVLIRGREVVPGEE